MKLEEDINDDGRKYKNKIYEEDLNKIFVNIW